MKKQKYRWWIGGGIGALILFFLFSNRHKTPVVETATVQRRDIIATVVESGTIRSLTEVPIAPDVSGEVVAIYVKDGDFVRKGDLLLTIKPDQYQAAYEQALANLNSARAEYENAKASTRQFYEAFRQDSIQYERARKLYGQNAISQSEYDQALFQYEQSRARYIAAQKGELSAFYRVENAKASLKQAKENLRRTNLYASQSGSITHLSVEVGQRVVGTGQMQGTEVMRISDLSKMIVEIGANENEVVKIKKGQKAKIEVDAYPGKVFWGNVLEVGYGPTNTNQISGSANVEQLTTYAVKILIDASSYRQEFRNLPWYESPFRPGMSALVTIYTDTVKQALSVPMQALTVGPDHQSEGVYRIDSSHRVFFVPLQLGINDEEYIEIKSGIEEGASIVLGPYQVLTEVLRDSMVVKVKNRPTP
jgi:HlyD family secretion protein